MKKAGVVLYFLSLSIWVGGAMALAFIVAPLAFKTLARPQAGNLFAGILRTFAWVELVCGVVGLVAALMGPRPLPQGVAVGLMLVLTLVQVFFVGLTLEELRPKIDFDPIRLQFNRWHRASEILFGLTILVGLVAIGLGAWPKDA